MVVPVALMVLAIVSIQLALPDSVTIGPGWGIPAIEILGLPVGWVVSKQTSMDKKAHSAGSAGVAYWCSWCWPVC